jgi:glycosyltransferase involved in cell wall biosynthesis
LFTKPRVVHVVDSLEIGGLERLVHDLVIARGAETTSVACLGAVGHFGEALRSRGIEVTLIGTEGGFLPTLARMWHYLRRTRPDIVHCHNLFALRNGGLAAAMVGGIPVVMTKHGVLLPRTGLAHYINHILARHADVVAVSREVMEIMETWKAGGRPVHYIPNGICVTPYKDLPSREEARSQLGMPVQPFIVGIVARVTPVKGHVLLIDVFARMLARLPGALLVIVGDGIRLPSVKARIQELGVGKSVLVMGERQDVPVILAAMDVFCLPSEMEGMPMTVLEAMAAGLPVVTSNVGGIPEVVEEGRTGLMVPPRSAGELEAALVALASDLERRRKMGRAGRDKLLSEFSLGKTAEAYEAVYRGAIGHGGLIKRKGRVKILAVT